MDHGLEVRVTRRQFIGSAAAAAASLTLFGCAPPRSGEAPGPELGGRPAVQDRSALATVHMATGAGAVLGMPEINGLTGIHHPEIWSVCHCPLSQYDHDYNVIPILAERLPSLDDGTWVVNSDGTMRLTWQLRPEAKWHDGHPFTSSDVRFSWEFINQAKEIPIIRRTAHTYITAIDTPDPQTAVMHWKVANTFANVMTHVDLFLYPEHIVRPLWESGGGEAILADGFFHDKFVGTGPYLVDRWDPDNTIVFKPFADFYRGPPRIGTIVLHQLENSQAVLTHLLSGQVQMALGQGLRFEEATVAQEQWEARGEGKVYFTPIGLQRLLVKPGNPLFRDVRVRRALLYAIDREEINRTFFRGTVQIAHSLLHPREPGFAAADAAITKYEFNPRRSVVEFEAAGWQRGSDGVLTNAAGDRFEVVYRASANDNEDQQIQGAVAKYWADIGVRTLFDNVSISSYNDVEERAKFLGVTNQGGSTSIETLFRRWHSSFIPTAENRYIGDNLPHWNDPEADRLLEQVDRTFDPAEAERVVVKLAQLFAEELPALPMYYRPEIVAIHKNLLNARPRPNSSGKHSSNWDLDQWEWAG